MKRTVYLLENKSGAPGSYVVNGVQHVLLARESVALTDLPVSVTGNIRRSTYVEDVPGGTVTDKKSTGVEIITTEEKKKNG